jgi:regulator of nonsense transcripts 2
MRSQQQAEKEEQQRIKNLVLNYDLRDENEGSDGESQFFFPQRNFDQSNIANGKENKVIEKPPQNPYLQPRMDKAGNRSKAQQARKLQLSDVDWYASTGSGQETSRRFTDSHLTAPYSGSTALTRRAGGPSNGRRAARTTG